MKIYLLFTAAAVLSLCNCQSPNPTDYKEEELKQSSIVIRDECIWVMRSFNKAMDENPAKVGVYYAAASKIESAAIRIIYTDTIKADYILKNYDSLIHLITSFEVVGSEFEKSIKGRQLDTIAPNISYACAKNQVFRLQLAAIDFLIRKVAGTSCGFGPVLLDASIYCYNDSAVISIYADNILDNEQPMDISIIDSTQKKLYKNLSYYKESKFMFIRTGRLPGGKITVLFRAKNVKYMDRVYDMEAVGYND